MKIRKTMESVEEKNEFKKFTEVERRNVQSVKKMITKAAELQQGAEHNPRIVVFSKISHKISAK